MLWPWLLCVLQRVVVPVRVWFYVCLDSVVADRSGMAAWLLSSGVAMCVDPRRFATWCGETHCNGCVNVAWGLCWGGSRSTKASVFPCEVAAAGDERYFVCAAGAAAVVSAAKVFLLCVLQRVVVPVCVVLVSWICGCRSQWNGCMIVVIWCCNVCRSVAGLRRDAAKRIVSCVKVAWCRGCKRNTIVFCSWRW